MTNAGPVRQGYTLGLAGRHLLIGPFRPRATLREGLNAPLSELGRFGLFATATALYALNDPSSRAASARYLETVQQSTGPYDWALGVIIIFIFLGALVLALYISQGATLYAAMRICTRSKATLATARLVIALPAWMTVGLSCLLLFAMRNLPPARPVGSQSLDILVLSAAIAPYGVLCVSAVTGSSLTRSAVIVLLAFLGDFAVMLGIDAGLDHLTVFLRSLNPEYDPA